MRTDYFERNLNIEKIELISTDDTQNSFNVFAEIVGPDGPGARLVESTQTKESK